MRFLLIVHFNYRKKFHAWLNKQYSINLNLPEHCINFSNKITIWVDKTNLNNTMKVTVVKVPFIIATILYFVFTVSFHGNKHNDTTKGFYDKIYYFMTSKC